MHSLPSSTDIPLPLKGNQEKREKIWDIAQIYSDVNIGIRTRYNKLILPIVILLKNSPAKGAFVARILLILLFGITQFAPISFSQQDISGSWQTTLNMGPQESRIVLKIFKGYAGAWAGRTFCGRCGIEFDRIKVS
jgi:hypothetical protein